MKITFHTRHLMGTANALVAPTPVFLAIWTWQFISHTVLDLGFDRPSAVAWAVVGLGVLAFVVGAEMGRALGGDEQARQIVRVHSQSGSEAAGVVAFSLPLAVTSAVLLARLTEDYGFGLLLNIKIALLEESVSGEKKSAYFVYAIMLHVFAVLYYAAEINVLRRAHGIALVAVTMVLCLFSGSRALVLFFLVALLPLTVFHVRTRRKMQMAYLAVACGAVPPAFFLYPVFFQSYEYASEGTEGIGSYAALYLHSGMSAFGSFVDSGRPSFDCILTVPRPILGLLDGMFGTDGANGCPARFPEVDVPLTTNVFTLFFQPMHDFGVWGVMLYVGTLGILSHWAYGQGFKKDSVEGRFLYSVIFYTICTSFFEDQFSRGLIWYACAAVVLGIVRTARVAVRYRVRASS